MDTTKLVIGQKIQFSDGQQARIQNVDEVNKKVTFQYLTLPPPPALTMRVGLGSFIPRKESESVTVPPQAVSMTQQPAIVVCDFAELTSAVVLS